MVRFEAVGLMLLLALALVAALHGVGAAHLSVLLVVSVPALASGIWALLAAPKPGTWLKSPALVFLALASFSALQALPLPLPLLASIAPRNAEVWQLSVRPWHGVVPSFATISLDPGASWVEALKWIVYAAIFVSASRIACSERSRSVVLLVFAAALSAALSLVLHGVLGAKALYGIYTPSFGVSPWRLGPLLNSNNLAGYLNLGVFCGLGLLRSRRNSASSAWLFALGVAVLGACVVLTGSRGGVGALLLGTVLFLVKGLFDRTLTSGARRRGSQRAPLVGAIVGIGCLVVLGARPGVWNGLTEEGSLKLTLIAKVGALVAEHPWLGVGRGAFESAFMAYAHHHAHERFQYAENFLAQWTAEWGIPATVLALTGLVVSLWSAVLACRRTAALWGAFVGVVALLLQNLVDLGLELPAVGMAGAALLGAIWGGYEKRHGAQPSGATETSMQRVGAQRAAMGAALLLAGVYWNQARVHGSPTLEDDLRRTYETVAIPSPARRQNYAAIRAELMARVARHPAEPNFFLSGGALARETGENALPWIGRAIELSGGSGRAHLLLAMTLAERGITAQALLSLRLAVQAEPRLARSVAPLALRYASNWDTLMAVVPPGRPGADCLAELARAAKTPEQRELRTRLLRAGLSRAGDHEGAMLMRANDIIADMSEEGRTEPLHGACPRGSAQCKVELGLLAMALATAGAPSNAKLEVYARWLALDARAEEADRYLETRCPATEAPRECWRLRALVASQYASTAALVERLETYVAVGCDTSARCAAAAKFSADLLSGRGAHGAALPFRLRAASEGATGPAWIAAARTALSAGQSRVARSALLHAQELGAPNTDGLWQELLRQEGTERPPAAP